MQARATNAGARLFLVTPGADRSGPPVLGTGEVRVTSAGKTLPLRPGFAPECRLNHPVTQAKHTTVRSSSARTSETALIPDKSSRPTTNKPASGAPTAQSAGAESLPGGKRGRQEKAKPAPAKPRAVKKAAVEAQPKPGKPGDRKTRRGQSSPKVKSRAAREVSKKETVLALLRGQHGATLQELMQATGWQSHSVRGFLSGTVRKKMALKLKSRKRDNGERVYSVRS